jgi:O-antigen ligase
MVLVGGTDAGRYVSAIRTLSAVLAAAFVAVWLRRAAIEADTTDRLVLGATLLFLLTCVTSQFMRDSLDAATTAVAFAAVVFVARGALADAHRRDLAITVLALSGLALSTVFFVVWAGVWARWLSVPGAGLPPLDLVLPIGPYRHHHVVGTTVALLMPALVVLARRPVVWPLGVIGLASGASVVFMSGSRTAWLALIAGMLIPVFIVWPPQRRRIPAWVWLAAMVVAASLLTVGVAQPLLARLTGTASIELRGAIWGSTLGQWLASPIVGSGPGSFFSTFTLSGYFDSHIEIGRHADNSVIQLLAEAGLVGLGALGLMLAGLVIGIRRAGRHWAPFAGLAIFGLASMTDNPSDSAHLVLIGIVWMALAAPRASPRNLVPPQRTVRMSAYVAALVIAIATGATLAASWLYERAADGNSGHNPQRVLGLLEAAAALDPSFALYQRELGVRYLASGDVERALSRIGAATRLNPADATAQRAMAIAFFADGRTDLALAAARRAVELGGLHAENQLTLAYVAGHTAAGREEAGRALVAALQPYPWLASSPGWEQQFPGGDSLQRLLESADEAWPEALVDTGRYDTPRAWLAAMVGRIDDYGAAVGPAVLVIQCKLDAATAAVEERRAERFTFTGLVSSIIVARVSGSSAADLLALAKLRTPLLRIVTTTNLGATSPLGGQIEDTRLYRRLALAPPEMDPMFPTPDAGLGAWLRNPVEAARVGAPGSALATCR